MKQQLVHERGKLLSTLGKLLEGPMIFLGFVWLILLVVELVWGLSKLLEYVSMGIWALFFFDFLLRLWLAPQKGVYLKKNWLTAISLVLPALRVVRIFRFVRLLRGVRLIRIVSSLNRGMRSLAATMRRRAVGYVLALTLLVTFAGAAGMYALEQTTAGFETYGASLWWTAMRVITAGSGAEPASAEGKALAFLLALFGYTIFGYVTATFASFFIGRDAEEKEAPLAGAADLRALQQEIKALKETIAALHQKLS